MTAGCSTTSLLHDNICSTPCRWLTRWCLANSPAASTLPAATQRLRTTAGCALGYLLPDERCLLPLQVAYLLVYGNLPSSQELGRWEEAVARHSAVPGVVENAIAALPHDAHFMVSHADHLGDGRPARTTLQASACSTFKPELKCVGLVVDPFGCHTCLPRGGSVRPMRALGSIMTLSPK